MTFEERVGKRYGGMSPAEQRVVRFFRNHREEVLIASAATMGAKAKTSDATVIRAARRLGYARLDTLRNALAGELRNALSPAERLTRTLTVVGDSVGAAFRTTIKTHVQCLEALQSSIMPGQFEQAVAAVVAVRRIAVFGIGPSSTIADYLAIQLRRFGIDAIGLTHTGLLFADDLGKLRDGDLVILLAYSRVYAEVAALLDVVEELHLRAILITDTLAAALRRRVELVLSVPRGQSDMLSMHTATLAFIEALLVGVATQRPTETLTSLKKLNASRKILAGKSSRLDSVDR
jgi:DNA-binding MurR/RpiR family transcriptional regulator